MHVHNYIRMYTCMYITLINEYMYLVVVENTNLYYFTCVCIYIIVKEYTCNSIKKKCTLPTNS